MRLPNWVVSAPDAVAEHRRHLAVFLGMAIDKEDWKMAARLCQQLMRVDTAAEAIAKARGEVSNHTMR
jgi:hypothetical protein